MARSVATVLGRRRSVATVLGRRVPRPTASSALPARRFVLTHHSSAEDARVAPSPRLLPRAYTASTRSTSLGPPLGAAALKREEH